MSNKKFNIIRYICMSIGFILNVGFLACCVLLIFNVSNPDFRKVLLPIIISFASIAAVFCVLFGRIFCGFLCPLGFFGDIVSLVCDKLHLPKLDRDSRLMKVINIFNRFFLVFFILVVITLIVLAFFPDILSKISIPIFVVFIIPVVMLTFLILARRFFCNVCPLGSFIGLFKKLSIVRLNKNPKSCNFCGACYEACPMKIKAIYIENSKTNITDSKCIYCGECIKKCQKTDALSILIGKKVLYKSSKDEFLKTQYDMLSVSKKENKKNG